MSAEPFLKYLGGKRQLLPQIMRYVKERPNTYYEPFIGGGAVLFAMIEQVGITRAVVGDTNPDLIETYKQVRDGVEPLIKRLWDYANAHDEAFYYLMRDTNPGFRLERAARFIYLNKAGFNGLWRVNKAGKCNVPFGHNPKPNICDETRLRDCARALSRIDLDIECRDFTDAFYMAAEPGDLVYMDPPYVPISKTASFTGYAKAGFGEAEQIRLALFARHLSDRRVKFLLSNADCDETRKLYEGLTIESVQARRAVNSNATKRGSVGELLVSGIAP